MKKADAYLVRQCFSYDPDTGEIRWKIDNKRARVGQLAGHASHINGRRKITFQYRTYGANQIAWVCWTGEWATNPIDHINRDPSDDRWCNLREVTNAQNISNQLGHNNKHGYRGLYWVKHLNKWGARVTVNGRTHHIGVYTTPEAAYEAFKEAHKRLHGEFSPYHQNLPSGEYL